MGRRRKGNKNKKTNLTSVPDLENYDVLTKLDDILKKFKNKSSEVNDDQKNESNDVGKEANIISDDQRELILKLVRKNIERAESSHHIAKKMYEAVKRSSPLKITQAFVPESIIPPDYIVSLYDVRIAGYGPDETTYRKNKWIRENVTRGFTFMEITTESEDENEKEEKTFDFAIYANKKFTGGVGDEDEWQPESNDVWREFCIQKPEEATEVICMNKLNGEAGHFTVRCIAGEFYIIAGSKNVHLLFKDAAEIERYEDVRFGVAKTVAQAVWDTFNAMEEENVLCLKYLLNATKMTVVCEVLQPAYQHIVNLSHMKEPAISILMIAPVATQIEDSFTAIPPHLTLNMAKAFGLSTPDYYSISVKQIQESIIKMRKMKGSEGYVLYYLKGDKTIGLAKVKTAWYVMLRALREKSDQAFNSKKQKDGPLEDKIKATCKRFCQIQKWLKFNDIYRRKWEVLGGAFLHWLDKETKLERGFSKQIRPKFPVIWARFLADTERTDDFHYEVT